MNIHDATEQAYKNGYAKGVKDFAEQTILFLKSVGLPPGGLFGISVGRMV